MENAIYSTMFRNGKRTYFLDVKESKNGKRYAQLTEVRHDDKPGGKTITKIRIDDANTMQSLSTAAAEAAHAFAD